MSGERGAIEDDRRRLAGGFNWLGAGNAAARLVDLATVFAMLFLLTRQQVGIAALAVSIGMIVEALNGLGTSDAMIQAPTLARAQLDTVFWYVMAGALAAAGLTLAASPAIASAYGIAGMTGYLAAIAAKQPMVGAAVVPLALMNRDLQYRRITAVNLVSTVGAAATRLGVALEGGGAWAPVLGYVASGLVLAVGANVARPFRPGLSVRPAAIAALARFGRRAVVAGAAEQAFKNVDFLLVGWFYGAPSLAIYRVAFDVAMEPAMAVGTVVHRTVLPVLSRAASLGRDLTPILEWSLGRIATLVAPLAVALVLAAVPLATLLHDGNGRSYAAAARPLAVLAAAALVRALFQPFATALLGAGHPGLAARLSLATLVLLAGGISVAGATLGPTRGILAAAAIWLAIYPALLAWALVWLRRRETIGLAAIGRALVRPFLAACVLGVGAGGLCLLARGSGMGVRLAIVLLATGLCYGWLVRAGLASGRDESGLCPEPHQDPGGPGPAIRK